MDCRTWGTWRETGGSLFRQGLLNKKKNIPGDKKESWWWEGETRVGQITGKGGVGKLAIRLTKSSHRPSGLGVGAAGCAQVGSTKYAVKKKVKKLRKLKRADGGYVVSEHGTTEQGVRKGQRDAEQGSYPPRRTINLA